MAILASMSKTDVPASAEPLAAQALPPQGRTENGDTWSAVQAFLRRRMSQPSFETWIAPLEMLSCEDSRVSLRAESDFNRDQILKRYRAELSEAFASVLGEKVQIAITVVEAETPPDAETAAGQFEAGAREVPQRAWTPRTIACNLNARYTFEQFVVGQHNRFCHAAALAVAETPAQSYNPFFIHGGVGLGKTHLMQAIGHFVLQHHTDLKVRYVTAEQFTNDMIGALTRKDMKGFQDRYRRNDVLIIDDVQFLEGKQRTQEEVFHTFNALHEAGKQVILSSDRAPNRLAQLEDRLRSRFGWGLIADIQPPDFETRLVILQRKLQREGLQRVPGDVLAYIAETYPGNVRELEGALNKVAAYGMLTRTPVDLLMAQSVLGTPVDAARLSLEDIVDTVAAYYHMRPGDLKSPSRAKDVSHARQVAIFTIRSLTEASFPKIGELLGGRKHTTILYAYEKIREELDHHPVLKQQIAEIQSRLKAR